MHCQNCWKYRDSVRAVSYANAKYGGVVRGGVDKTGRRRWILYMDGKVADVARVYRASSRKVERVESVGMRKNAPSGGRRQGACGIASADVNLWKAHKESAGDPVDR